MAVKIRLARHGAKKAPFYRVVVADGRSRRDGRFIEVVGRYNPRTEPSFVELDVDKVEGWIAKGAQPTEAVVKLLAIAKGEKQAPQAETKMSKKAAEKAAAEAEAAAKAAEEAAAAEAATEESDTSESVPEADEAQATVEDSAESGDDSGAAEDAE